MVNLLWVEEEQDSLRYERKIVEALEWNITLVSTIDDAKNKLLTENYNLIISDLIMPINKFEKDRGFVDVNAGINLLKWIRNPEIIKKTPADVLIVVISAVISSETKVNIIDKLVPPEYYLNKPIVEKNFQDLLVILNKILN